MVDLRKRQLMQPLERHRWQPELDVLSGSAAVLGTKVTQRVIGGVAGVTYKLRAQVDAADGSRYVLAGLLPVRGA